MTKEPLPTTHNAEGRCSHMCREEPETGSSLEASERQRVCSGICLRRSWRVIFKMLYTEIESLRKKHEDNNMAKH